MYLVIVVFRSYMQKTDCKTDVGKTRWKMLQIRLTMITFVTEKVY